MGLDGDKRIVQLTFWPALWNLLLLAFGVMLAARLEDDASVTTAQICSPIFAAFAVIILT